MAQMVKTAGIDVSKPWLDVATWPTREATRVSRDAAGIAALIAWLTEHEVIRVGLEASGGYDREVTDGLQAASFEVAQLNPLRVRRFAEAKGRLAKHALGLDPRERHRRCAHHRAVHRGDGRGRPAAAPA